MDSHRIFCRVLVSLFLVTALSQLANAQLAKAQAAPEPDARPNIVVILADDLGFSDLGCYGGEIDTPNLDRLANEGVRFTQFYNTGRCWPTRASLLTGYYAQSVRRDQVPGVASGGQGIRPAWARLLPQILGQAGYRCYHSGKWHIDGQALENGFHTSYLLKDQGRFFHPKVHFKNDVQLPAIPKDTDFYATTNIASEAISQLQTHAEHHSSQPFFLYLAFTAPHFPLQAPQALIDKYRDRYQAGWDKVRADRWARLQQLGFIPGQVSQPQPNVGPPYAFPNAIKQLGLGETNRPQPWDQLSSLQQTFQAEKMAVHAAMIDAMDQQIGRVIAKIEAMNSLDNTFVLFLSDNGASAEIMIRDDGHDPNAPLGSARSYICLGPGWSTCCNTPFRYHKTWVHEGGIATPAIASWPVGIKNMGSFCQQPAHVIDLFPTALQLAQIAAATQSSDTVAATLPEKPGKSLLAFLTDEEQPTLQSKTQSDSRLLYWSHEGNRAVRSGKWKLVAVKDGQWELYNLEQDRAETKDVSEDEPQKVAELIELWNLLDAQQTQLAKLPRD